MNKTFAIRVNNKCLSTSLETALSDIFAAFPAEDIERIGSRQIVKHGIYWWSIDDAWSGTVNGLQCNIDEDKACTIRMTVYDIVKRLFPDIPVPVIVNTVSGDATFEEAMNKWFSIPEDIRKELMP